MSRSIGTPNPIAMRELLDFLHKARMQRFTKAQARKAMAFKFNRLAKRRILA